MDKCYTELTPLQPLPICICSVPIKTRNPENRVEHVCTRACSNILVRVTCITDVCSISYESLEGSRSVCHCQHSKSIIEHSAFLEKQTPSEVLQKHSFIAVRDAGKMAAKGQRRYIRSYTTLSVMLSDICPQPHLSVV